MKQWTLELGCDEAGFQLKEFLLAKLSSDPRVAGVRDAGVRDGADATAYPEIGLKVAEDVAEGQVDRALLICGTGIGMAISANKVPGIRATTAHDVYSVERSILSNNCQVLTLGARVVAPELAWSLVDRWLDLQFDESSPSASKVQIISDYDERGR